MTESELKALLQLAGQESYRIDQLPQEIDAAMLRRLDDLGIVEYRPWHLQNVTTDPKNPLPMEEVPSGMIGWVSPNRAPGLAGSWESILEALPKPRRAAGEVRPTAKGRAECDRAREAETARANQAREIYVQRQNRLIASSFRAGRDTVYPGKLVIVPDGDTRPQAIDDESFDPAHNILIGIALWGSQAEFARGCVSISNAQHEYVAIASGEFQRPKTKIGRIDAWIARADLLRRFLQGRTEAFGGICLSASQLDAAAHEIGSMIRDTALALLNDAPQSVRPSLLALAAVVDSLQPTEAELRAAIVELLASVGAWQEHFADPLRVPEGVVPTRKRRKRKGPLVKQERALTPVEVRTIKVVSNHGGNFAAAALELGRNPKTVRENFKRAMEKTNRISGHKSRSVNASRLPEDHRGQVRVSGKRGG